MCLQPGHILRDCPDFSCHKCEVQRHYARECGADKGTKAEAKCEIRFNIMSECICKENETDLLGAEDEEEEEVSDEEEMECGAGVAVRAYRAAAKAGVA